jgi:hypothetical protein
MGIATTGGGSVRLYGKFGGLAGESSQSAWREKGFSDILSFSIGGSASWSFEGSKSVAGGASFGGLSVSLPMIGTAPQLLIGCLKEKQLSEVEIAVGGDKIDSKLFMVRLEGEVRMIGCQIDGSQGGSLNLSLVLTAPIIKVENLEKKKKDDINYGKIEQKNDVL